MPSRHGTGVRLPPPPFDSRGLGPRSLMASHRKGGSGFTAGERRSASNVLSEVEGQSLLLCTRRNGPLTEHPGRFFVYILRCADGAFYVGSTSDLPSRIQAHNAGRGPRFTSGRRPVTPVYSEPFDSMEQARKRETQLKKWSRAKKKALIAGELDRLKLLASSRGSREPT
jgi:putative endonuclease